LIVDAPVVQTSSTITTRAPSRQNPSIRRPVPCAGGRHVADNRVGTHGEATDGFGVDSLLFQQFQHGVAGQPAAFGVQRRGAAVDVVVADATGG
jgi:hypothetical protein